MRNRLFSICPYFAIFPEKFAEEKILQYSAPADLIYDPFYGRGTSLLQALLLGRNAAGTDVNPVAFCITAAKLRVPSLARVLVVLDSLTKDFSKYQFHNERNSLPAFFNRAFHPDTLAQLLYLRSTLRWRTSEVHRFIAAIVLGSLHGEMDKSSSYFSNQMPRTISTKPNYSLRFWERNGLLPPHRDVFKILRDRAAYRIKPEFLPRLKGRAALLDARLSTRAFPQYRGAVRLVLTSPPYLDVTNYEEDQWLRLWFLGQSPAPSYFGGDNRHSNEISYWEFLTEVWEGIEPLIARGCNLVCRIGARKRSVDELQTMLPRTIREIFPRARLRSRPIVTSIKNRQTDYFRPGTSGCKTEVDFVMSLN